jgi:hypothetical protein
MNGHIPKDTSGNLIPTPPEFWLMYASLLKTDIYNSIEKRLGRGLLAQRMVSQYFSEALGDYHWVDEVERLVATLHARTQINAWSVASGEDSVHEGKDGYTLMTPPEKYGNLCGIFKYNPPGYASIHFVPLILVLLSFPVCWLLSMKWVSITGSFKGVFRFINLEWVSITKGFKTSDTVGVRPRSPGARGAEEQITPQPTDSTTIKSEETTTGIGNVAGPSGSFSANVPPGDGDEVSHDRESLESVDIDRTEARWKGKGHQCPKQEQQIPPFAKPIVGRGSDTGGTTTTTNDSVHTEWEPFLIDKIIWLLLLLFLRLPIKGFAWLGCWKGHRNVLGRYWQDRRNINEGERQT